MNSILITDCKDCIETHDIQQKPKLYPPTNFDPNERELSNMR